MAEAGTGVSLAERRRKPGKVAEESRSRTCPEPLGSPNRV
jgi:hypothetical protein